MHGRGEVTYPDHQPEARDVALRQTSPSAGSPFEPTGNPMVDGVGPAAWAPRRDAPELTGHGHPKIVPMIGLPTFQVSAGTDPRGKPVQAHDGIIVGEISDMWVDEPEQMVRYLEMTLDAAYGGGKRLVPVQLVRILDDRITIHSLYAEHFKDVPTIAAPYQVTMLEEEKISAYYAGGKLYATPERLEPQI